MALSDKNILITPNVGQASDPKITFSGADSTTGPQNISLLVYPTNSGTVSFEGSAGQLFSITNSLSGTIYSVNDVSGIPSIEVLDTGQIKLAEYSGFVSIPGTTNATSTTTGVLRVSGGVGIAQDLYLGGSVRLLATGGYAQAARYTLRYETTDATTTSLTTDGAAAGAANQVILTNNEAVTFSILVTGKRSTASSVHSASWKIEGLIRRDGSASATYIVNSATTVISNVPGWTVAVSADTTNGALSVRVTGAAATNVRWLAVVDTAEVTYA